MKNSCARWSRARWSERLRRTWRVHEGHFIEKFTQPGEEISLYRNGRFVDFCRGPHVPSTGRVKAFKVTVDRRSLFGWGMRRTSSCSGSMGRRSSTRRTWRLTSSAWKRQGGDSSACWAKQLDLFSIQEVAGSG